MKPQCNAVVFSNKAYNAIIRETFEHEPIETGGILLGHVVDDTWVVMEVLPPGIRSIFQLAYFEYDEEFVNYLAHSVANQYKQPLSLLGLWHRHPGSMDVFSGTDDQTNRVFARQLSQGVISGLVNVDPRFRFTMYYLNAADDTGVGRPNYVEVPIEVGDDIIPPDFFTLRYFNDVDNSDLHPTVAVNREMKYRHGTGTVVNPPQGPQTPEKEEGLQSASNNAVFQECAKRLYRIAYRYWKEILIPVLIIVIGVLLWKIWFKPDMSNEKQHTKQVTSVVAPNIVLKDTIIDDQNGDTIIINVKTKDTIEVRHKAQDLNIDKPKNK